MAERPAYWAVIPASVRYDQDLPPNAKLLYGEITALSNAKGYCSAHNAYFADLFGLGEKSVSRLIAILAKGGYLRVEVIRNEKNEVVERRTVPIYGADGVCPPPLKNEDRIIQENNTSNNPPYNPPKGDDKRRQKKRRPKAVPEWQPERFEGFWNAYPRDEDRAKAVEQWDLIPQDQELMEQYTSEDELLHEMSVGLKRHLDCEDWREGRGIPYAFRWLRDRKWTEKKKTIQSQKADRPPGPGDNAPTRVVEEEGTYLL